MASSGAVCFSKVVNVVYLHPVCHPGKAVHVRIIKGELGIVNCAECNAEVARFSLFETPKREPLPDPKPRSIAEERITFGGHKNVALKDISSHELERIVRWCQDNAACASLIQKIQHYLKTRGIQLRSPQCGTQSERSHYTQ